MQLQRTTKKSSKTTTLAEQVDVTGWNGNVTLTAETAAEYFQVRMTAEEARALAAQLLAIVGKAAQ